MALSSMLIKQSVVSRLKELSSDQIVVLWSLNIEMVQGLLH
nr:MAG TPA: hypothetical protein [Siphoviridae sp. ctuHV12]DAR05710.1 MAG TPA: hypothetical protein [Caudoviricetes sp.]